MMDDLTWDQKRALTIALAKEKVSRPAIATALGLNTTQVHHIVQGARDKGVDIPLMTAGRAVARKVSITLSKGAWEYHDSSAAFRDQDIAGHCTRMLEVIARDQIAGAVLDDKQFEAGGVQ